MNILLEFSTLNYQTYHGAAKRLKEYFPNSRFAGIMGIAPNGEAAVEFLENQRDIKYEFLIKRHDLAREALKDEIDHELLRSIEKTIPQKSIWRLVSADRLWGHAYVHGVYTPKAFQTENATRDNILKSFCGLFKRFEKIFDDFQAGLFVPAMCMGSIDVYILEEICRRRGVPYASVNTTRVKNMFAFGVGVELMFPHIDQTYLDIYEGRRQIDLKPAEKVYDEIVADMTGTLSADLQALVHKAVKTETASKKKLILSSARAASGTVKRWIKMRPLNTSDDTRRQPYTLTTLFHNIFLSVGQHYQAYRMLSSDFGENPKPGEKYIYYPLHVNPEYSTNFQGPMWMNQVYTIELLSRSVPYDWFVYVKEHPAMLIARVRPKSFYDQIRKYPNVRLMPSGISSFDLIKNAQMIAIVTGTSGWEGILQGKPVLQFVDNYFDVLGLTRKYSTIENLPLDIQQEQQRIANFPAAERKKRLICYLAAIMEHCFIPENPLQLFNEPGTPEQFEIAGRGMADALISYLKHIGFIAKKEEQYSAVLNKI